MRAGPLRSSAMGLNNLLVAAACLAVGGAVGYGLRSSQTFSMAGVASAAPATSKDAASYRGGPGADGGGAEARKDKDGEGKPLTVPLAERMKALLVDYSDGEARKALAKLSEAEVQSALALLATMPKTQDRDSLRASLYRAWAKLNPAAAWKAALEDKTGNSNGSYLSSVAGEVAKTQPAKAIDLALSLGMGGRRAEVLQSVFSEWSKVDAQAAVAYLNKHPDLPSNYWGLGQALGEVAEKDPVQAAALALSLSDQQTRNYALSSVLGSWAQRDPKAALSWASSIANPKQREDATSQTFRGWAEQDPQAAMTAAAGLGDANLRQAALQAAWQSWFSKDPAAAMRYMGQSGDERLMRNVGWNLGNGGVFTPQETMDLLANIPDGQAKQDMVNNIVSNDIWRGRFAEAIGMLNGLPDSSQRDWSLEELGRKWAEADAPATAAWLKQQPDSTDRDLAVAGLSTTLAKTDPQAAIQWAESIPDDGVKSSTLKNIAVRWLSNDPARAEAWMAGITDWSDSEKENLRTSAKRVFDGFNYGFNVKNRR